MTYVMTPELEYMDQEMNALHARNSYLRYRIEKNKYSINEMLAEMERNEESLETIHSKYIAGKSRIYHEQLCAEMRSELLSKTSQIRDLLESSRTILNELEENLRNSNTTAQEQEELEQEQSDEWTPSYSVYPSNEEIPINFVYIDDQVEPESDPEPDQAQPLQEQVSDSENCKKTWSRNHPARINQRLMSMPNGCVLVTTYKGADFRVVYDKSTKTFNDFSQRDCGGFGSYNMLQHANKYFRNCVLRNTSYVPNAWESFKVENQVTGETRWINQLHKKNWLETDTEFANQCVWNQL